MNYQLLNLGVDGKIHCCEVSDKEISTCEDKVPVAQVNPDFWKLPDVVWCYECSAIFEEQEEEFSYYER